MKLSGVLEAKRRNIWKQKLRKFELRVRPKISVTCVGTSMTLTKNFQPRANIVKDEKGDLVTDWHNILAKWRNHFSQLLNVQCVNRTAEPLVPEPIAFEIEMAIEKLKRTNHQVLIKSQQNWLVQGVDQMAVSSINLLFIFWIKLNCLRGWRIWKL